MDGPLTFAVRSGAICYLDEVVEARKDTTVVVHSLTDHRRVLPIEKTGELIDAHADFLLVMSYNPGYQSVLKDLKPSTRQRFVSLEFTYPGVEVETRIISHEGGVDAQLAQRLALIGEKVRNLRELGFEEGVSTRLLVYAAQLVARGIAPRRACDVAVAGAVTDDPHVREAITAIVDVLLP
jgi:nitric oxide reductase NorQ protein